MGGGRKAMGNKIDHRVGLEMLVRIGDSVERGQPVARVFCDDPVPHTEAVQSAVSIGDYADSLPLIVDRIA